MTIWRLAAHVAECSSTAHEKKAAWQLDVITIQIAKQVNTFPFDGNILSSLTKKRNIWREMCDKKHVAFSPWCQYYREKICVQQSCLHPHTANPQCYPSLTSEKKPTGGSRNSRGKYVAKISSASLLQHVGLFIFHHDAKLTPGQSTVLCMPMCHKKSSAMTNDNTV